jgi:SAM-dependent methyltransferase
VKGIGMPDPRAVFGEQYYAHGCGVPYRRDDHWFGFFEPIADRIVRDLAPRRVLDAGCAIGVLVELLRRRGVEAYGFDVSEYAIAQVPDALKPYCWRASITDEIQGQYDLIVCLEVMAHVPVPHDGVAIANFCRHADQVLFSAARYDPAPLHFNLSPPEHYATLFAAHGLYRDTHFDASFVTPWAVRFRRVESVAPVIGEYERHTVQLADRVASLSAEVHGTTAALAAARATIAGMQSSWFWKARRPWAWLTRR